MVVSLSLAVVVVGGFLLLLCGGGLLLALLSRLSREVGDTSPAVSCAGCLAQAILVFVALTLILFIFVS